MATGLCIYHPTLRNAKLMLHHPGNKQTGRKPKDYPIQIDSEGKALVSETVWMRLQQAKASGASRHDFVVLSEVKDPPTQSVSWVDNPQQEQRIFKQVGAALQEIFPEMPSGFQVNINS